METKICIQCKKEFERRKTQSVHHFRNQKCCSIACANKNKMKGYIFDETRKCAYCGKNIKKPKYRIVQSTRLKMKCCGKDCQYKLKIGKTMNIVRPEGRHNWRYKEELHYCPVCGKKKTTPDGKRCRICTTKELRGSNHPNYKDGSSIIGRHYNYEYKQRRISVYKRDRFTCQFPGCGQKSGDIQVHHIKKRRDYPDLRFEITNGITLCKKHHNKTRSKEKQYEQLFEQIITTKHLSLV